MKNTIKPFLAIPVTLFLMISLIVPNVSFGQHANFSNCKLEFLKDKEGKQFLKFSYSLNVQNAKGHTIRVMMNFESPKGTCHLNKNDKPLRAWKDFNINYPNSSLNDKCLTIYTSKLNPLPGKNTYYVYLTAEDLTTDEMIGSSGYLTYTQTGGYPKKAQFFNYYLEQDVENQGKNMLKCNYTMNVTGMKDQEVKVVMHVETPKGTDHAYKDGRKMTVEKVLTPSYNDTNYKNRWFGIYNNSLNLLPGKHTYYVRLIAYEKKTGKKLGESTYMKFTKTGAYK